MKTTKCVVAVGLVWGALAVPTTVLADAILNTSAQVQGQYPGQQCSQQGTTTASCSASAQIVFDPPHPDTLFFGGSASAKASFGLLGASASALASCDVTTGGLSCGGLLSGNVAALATFVDSITISNGPASGMLNFTVQTSGFGSVTCIGPDTFICNNSFALSFLETPTTEIIDGMRRNSTFLPVGVSPHDLQIPFTSGNPVGFELGLGAEVRCLADNTTNCSAISNFIDTAQITGVEVLDANGHVFSGATITSLSGTNYNAINGHVPTPEPNTLTLLAASFLGFMAFTWRYKRQA